MVRLGEFLEAHPENTVLLPANIVLYLFLCYRHKVDPISDGIRLIASLDLHVSCGNIYVEQ